jgi:PAS domain S-box-containing protein
MSYARRVRWMTWCHALCLVLLLADGPCVGVADAQAQPQAALNSKVDLSHGQETTMAGNPAALSEKNVLLLHAYTYETASYLIMDPIFVKGFVDAGLERFNLHFEFMDVAKHPDPAHRREFGQYLSRKFEQHPVDLIIALHSPAFDFLVEEGSNLLPGVPVISVIAASEFLSNEDFRYSYERQIRPLKRPFVILPYSTDVESTVKSIISLRPDTRTLVVISGSGFIDRTMRQAVDRGLQAWQGRLLIDSLDALPLREVLERIATLAPKTAVLFVNFSADPDGSVYSPPEVVRRISRAANAPVFGLFDTLLGNRGIVGGIMPTFAVEAERTVRQALEILRGALPTEPVTILRAAFNPMFDWEQLKRWGIDENKLPSGSVVLNRPRTLWSQYRGFVVGSIAVFLLQTMLVSGLWVQKRHRRSAEESLRQRTEELDQFFNVTLDLLCIANTGGYFVRLNPAWEKVLGYSREELMAKRFFDFVHTDDLTGTEEALAKLASQRALTHFENRYRCKDGTYRWLEWTSAPAGELVYAAAHDVTERFEVEAEARQRREELAHMARVATMGELTASLAHEINQPLSAIMSNAQAAKRFLDAPAPDLQELKEILHDIIKEDARAGDIISRLRSLLKKTKTDFELLDLSLILREVIGLLHSDAVIRDVKVDTELGPRLPLVRGDRIQLQQVAVNLILNAFDALNERPRGERRVLVRTCLQDSQVLAAVVDSGNGIPGGEAEKIFNPFYTSKPQGLGMGLSISRSIITRHQGRIWVENNPDGGATFYFSLPVPTDEEIFRRE